MVYDRSKDHRGSRQYMEQELRDIICAALQSIGNTRPSDPPAYMMKTLSTPGAPAAPSNGGSGLTLDEDDMYAFLRHSSVFQLLKPTMRACTQCRPPEPRKFMIDFLGHMLQQNAISAQ